jgi:hypothetical protein
MGEIELAADEEILLESIKCIYNYLRTERKARYVKHSTQFKRLFELSYLLI